MFFNTIPKLPTINTLATWHEYLGMDYATLPSVVMHPASALIQQQLARPVSCGRDCAAPGTALDSFHTCVINGHTGILPFFCENRKMHIFHIMEYSKCAIAILK
jgi:hypothetical protein